MIITALRTLTKEERNFITACQSLVNAGVTIEGAALEKLINLLGENALEALPTCPTKVGELVEVQLVSGTGEIEIVLSELPKGTKRLIIKDDNGSAEASNLNDEDQEDESPSAFSELTEEDEDETNELGELELESHD